jgi:hypothetical protein
MRKIELSEDDLNTLLGHDRDQLLVEYRVYIDLTERRLIEVFEDDGESVNHGMEEGENRRLLFKIRNRPKDFLEIPIPDHGQWHDWFCQFLADSGRRSPILREH